MARGVLSRLASSQTQEVMRCEQFSPRRSIALRRCSAADAHTGQHHRSRSAAAACSAPGWRTCWQSMAKPQAWCGWYMRQVEHVADPVVQSRRQLGALRRAGLRPRAGRHRRLAAPCRRASAAVPIAPAIGSSNPAMTATPCARAFTRCAARSRCAMPRAGDDRSRQAESGECRALDRDARRSGAGRLTLDHRRRPADRSRREGAIRDR